jgi:hypothetical protein
MTRPLTFPRWADAGGAIVVPTSGKLDIGFVPGERPPAQYVNWFQNLDYQWLQYLDGQVGGGEKAVGLALGQGATGIATSGMPLFAKSTGAYLFTTDAIDLAVGCRINFVRIRVYKAGASDVHVLLNKYATNVVLSVGVPAPVNIMPATAVTGGATTYQDSTCAVSSPVAITTGEKWYIQVDGSDTGDIVMHLSVFWDVP